MVLQWHNLIVNCYLNLIIEIRVSNVFVIESLVLNMVWCMCGSKVEWRCVEGYFFYDCFLQKTCVLGFPIQSRVWGLYDGDISSFHHRLSDAVWLPVFAVGNSQWDPNLFPGEVSTPGRAASWTSVAVTIVYPPHHVVTTEHQVKIFLFIQARPSRHTFTVNTTNIIKVKLHFRLYLTCS